MRAIPAETAGRLLAKGLSTCLAAGAPGEQAAADRLLTEPPEVAEWLRGGQPAALLTAAGNTATDLELLEELSWALELLEVVQHQLPGGLGDRAGQ